MSTTEGPFGRVLTAMATPFGADGAVDLERAAELAAALASNGSDGLVVSGTTGEAPTLSHEEKLLLWETVRQAVPHACLVLAGSTGNDTRSSVELTRQAAALGVDGILAVTPYYNKPPQDGLLAHFRAIAEAADGLPVLLYNVPARTGVNMLAQTTLELAKVDNIVAVKEASGDCEQVARIVAGAPEGFAVYSGDDSFTLPFCAVGAVGVVSVAGHLVGPAIQNMLGHFFDGRFDEATALHLRLLPFFRGLFMTTNPIPLKAALRCSGFDCGPLRLPLIAMGERDGVAMGAILDEISDLVTLAAPPARTSGEVPSATRA